MASNDDRQWVHANFDCLVHSINGQEILDKLVSKGWFLTNKEDYQTIRAARTPVEGARRLVEAVLAKTDGAVTDLRSVATDIYRDKVRVGISSIEVRQQRVQQREGLSDHKDALAHESNPSSPALSAPSSVSINSALRRRRQLQRSKKVRWSRYATPAVIGLGVTIAYLAQWLKASASYRGEIGQPPPAKPARQTSSHSYSEALPDIPKAVLDFRDNVLARDIEGRAFDNAFPWLDEPLQPVEKLHVRLVITTKGAHWESDRSPFYGNTPAMSIPDHDPMEGTIPVNVSDIFDPGVDDSTVPISRIILRAEAGMGKTFTFAKTMPLRWLRQNSKLWPDIVLLFVVHLGDPDVQKATTFKDIFFSGFSTVGRETKKAVMDFIRSHPERVLLVCDAFDEGGNYLPEIFLRILQGRAFQGLRVLVTSRPCAGIRKLAKHAHRQLELLGLAEEDLPEFIQKQLQREPEAKFLSQKLQHQLQDRKDMVNLMGSPLIASLVCGLFAKQQHLPGSTTELYERIVINLLRRAHDKSFPDLLSMKDEYRDNPRLLDLTGKAGDVISHLGHLALYGVQNGKVVFTIPKVEKRCSRAVLEMGVLARLSKTGKALSSRDHVAFFHLTFMEFFASLALTKSCMKHPYVSFQLNVARTECVAGALSEFPIDVRERNIIIWFFAAGQVSLLGRAALYEYSLTGRNLLSYYPKSCDLIRSFLKHGDVAEHSEVTWLVTLSVLQIISELHVDTKREGGHFPGFCSSSHGEILKSLKGLVQRYSVLDQLVSTPYWMENQSSFLTTEYIFLLLFFILIPICFYLVVFLTTYILNK